MKNTAKQAPADAAATATAHRPETEAGSPDAVTLSRMDALNVAGWLRRFLSDSVGTDSDGLCAEDIQAVAEWIGVLEKTA